MREFSKVSPAVWLSKRFTNLASDDAKLCYLYLLTSEHQNSAGVYRLKDEYAVADLRWTMDRYFNARAQLIEADLIRFDADTSTVMIKRWFRHNGPMNESHYKGVMKVIRKIEHEAFSFEASVELADAYEAVKASKAETTTE